MCNSIAGHRYQDKYAYVVPSSINNPEGQPYRVQYAAAVDYWKNILTASQKRVYNVRAGPVKGLSGYCLFIKEALTGKVAMFVDRGDPASVDFIYTDLITDGTWRELDLSVIVPTIARGVLIELDIESAHVDNEVIFRKYENTNDINHTGAVTKTNNKDQHKTCIVGIASNQKIEYKADDATWSVINIAVRGWWT